ncbi:Alpha/beta hydrolase fold-1 [Apodospora peruviana]|uniref:Alpha/beta hydrolase fold-1 n=1 Tax=Apodospora peruviana TaxID=516989 RepID=A0AAE0I6K8_9PEZI|nr:Alpha/beta hydrolase fold-1 [Apodospora peruviana]
MAPSKPVIVIIPGGFHRPSHYELISTPLQDQGYTVLSAPLAVCGDEDVNPAATAIDDARKIHEQLLPLLDDGQEAIVVAHSYGSLPATECIQGQTKAERASRGLKGGIVAAVWIAAFAFPAKGKNIMGGDEETPPMPYHIVKDGLLSLTEDARPLFYSDLPTEAADKAWASVCKFQSHKSLSTFPRFIESEITIPKTYLLCEKDQAVPPEFQQMMAQVGKFEHVVKLDSGHSPFLRKPGDVVEAIVTVCNQVICA